MLRSTIQTRKPIAFRRCHLPYGAEDARTATNKRLMKTHLPLKVLAAATFHSRGRYLGQLGVAWWFSWTAGVYFLGLL